MVASATDFISDADLEGYLRQSLDDDGVRMRTALAGAISFVEQWIDDAIIDTTIDLVDDHRPVLDNEVLCIPRSFITMATLTSTDDQRVERDSIQATTNPGGVQAHIIPDGRFTFIRPPLGGWPSSFTDTEGDFTIRLSVGASTIDPLWRSAALDVARAIYDREGIEDAKNRAIEMLSAWYRY